MCAGCPHKLSREVKISHRTARCARHFLVYVTFCYVYRSERCTPCMLSRALTSLALVPERSIPLFPTCTLIFFFKKNQILSEFRTGAFIFRF